LIALPFYWLLALFAQLFPAPPGTTHPPPQPPPAPPVAPGAPAGDAGASLLSLAGSLVFWVLALGLLIYVVRSYLRDRPELARALLALAPVRGLAAWWAAVWAWLAGRAQALQALSVRAGAAGAAGAAAQPAWFRFWPW